MTKFKNLKELVERVKKITYKFDPNGELPVFQSFVKTFSQLRPDQVTEANKIRDPKLVNLIKNGICVEDYEELMLIENQLIDKLMKDPNKANADHDLLIKAVMFKKQLEAEYDQTIQQILQTGTSLMELDSRVAQLAKRFAAADVIAKEEPKC